MLKSLKCATRRDRCHSLVPNYEFGMQNAREPGKNIIINIMGSNDKRNRKRNLYY